MKEFAEVLKLCFTNYSVTARNSVRQKDSIDLY